MSVALHHALHDRPAVANSTDPGVVAALPQGPAVGACARGRQSLPRHSQVQAAPARPAISPGTSTGGWARRCATARLTADISAPAAAALRLLILTGCRRDEILTLRWDDVDLHARELRLRDSKSGPCMVALTPAVETVLDGIRRIRGNPWVIVGEVPGSRLKTLKTTWRRVKLRAGLKDVRLHDLRHSYATRALALGESLTMIGKLLNHAQMQSTARYAHVMDDAEKAAAARVGDRIAAHVAGHTAAAARGRRR